MLVSRSGGQAVLLADAAAACGFSLGELPPTLADFVSRQVKAGVIRPTNPIDLGDVFDIRSYGEMIEMSLKDEGVDGVLVFHYFPEEEKVLSGDLIRTTAELSLKHQKPVAFCVLPGRRDALSFDPNRTFRFLRMRIRL